MRCRPRREFRVLPLLCAAWAATAWSGPVQADAIEDVAFPETARVGGAALELHGVATLRYRWLFDVYHAALYLPPGSDAEQLLDDAPRRFEIHYFYDFSAQDFAKATQQGILDNLGADATARLAPQIERFNRLYRDVEPGDRYALSYDPGRGTELSLNGAALGVVEGAEFSRALFSIWFGPSPFDSDLKRELIDGRR